MKHTMEELRQWQALPLNLKVRMSMERIRMWVREYGEDGVYVSFSGGKDSTVLSHLVDRTFPGNEIPRVFVNTGLEYPEIVQFVKQEPRVVMLRPKMNFRQVIEKYGYPFFSKETSDAIASGQRFIKTGVGENTTRVKQILGKSERKRNGEISQYDKGRYKFAIYAPFPFSNSCCMVMKKSPAHIYDKSTGRVPITGEMAEESKQRTTNWMKNGCNMYDNKHPKSTPLAFWTEQDVLQYIKENGIQIASVYGEIVADEQKSENIEGQLQFGENGIEESKCVLKTTGCKRTGCMFCGYGCHLEKEGEGRFERMRITHPKIYEWVFKDRENGGLGYKKVIDWINEHGNMNIRY